MRARKSNLSLSKEEKQKAKALAKKKNIPYEKASRKIGAQRRLRPLLRRIVTISSGIVLITLLVFGIWAWQQGYAERFILRTQEKTIALVDRLSFFFGLELKHISIEGHRFVTKEAVLAATGLKPQNRYSMFRLSGTELQDNIETLQFVRRAAVEKHFPDTLLIRITERSPIAIWQNHGELSLVDVDGVVLKQGEVGKFWKLPLLVGEDAVFRAKSLFDFLVTEPALFQKIAAMSLIGDRRWDIVTQNGITIRLPEEHPEKAWARLATLNAEHQLLDKQIKIIDLRLPDKLYILPSEALPDPRAAAPTTNKDTAPVEDHD